MAYLASNSAPVRVQLSRNDLNGAKRLNDWNVWNELSLKYPVATNSFPC